LRQNLASRLRGDVKRNDFQQLLIEARKGELKGLGSDELDAFEKDAEINGSNMSQLDKAKILTDDVIVAQSLVFFLAGLTATANFLSFTALALALHPEIQKKLRKEIEKIVKEGGSFSYDDVAQSVYLDMVACGKFELELDHYEVEVFMLNLFDITCISFHSEVLRKFPGGLRLGIHSIFLILYFNTFTFPLDLSSVF